MAKPVLDFWYDFASTYSFLSAMRIAPLAEAEGVTVRWRPFLLGPIFQSQNMTTSPFVTFPLKGRNMWRDMERLADEIGIGFRRPSVFPQNSLLAARVAMAGMDEGWGEDFTRATYVAEFSDGRTISEPGVIADVLGKLKLPVDATLALAQSDNNKSKLRAQTEQAQKLELFGAPSFTTADGEMFWGNDRLERALRWAKRG